MQVFLCFPLPLPLVARTAHLSLGIFLFDRISYRTDSGQVLLLPATLTCVPMRCSSKVGLDVVGFNSIFSNIDDEVHNLLSLIFSVLCFFFVISISFNICAFYTHFLLTIAICYVLFNAILSIYKFIPFTFGLSFHNLVGPFFMFINVNFFWLHFIFLVAIYSK